MELLYVSYNCSFKPKWMKRSSGQPVRPSIHAGKSQTFIQTASGTYVASKEQPGQVGATCPSGHICDPSRRSQALRRASKERLGRVAQPCYPSLMYYLGPTRSQQAGPSMQALDYLRPRSAFKTTYRLVIYRMGQDQVRAAAPAHTGCRQGNPSDARSTRWHLSSHCERITRLPGRPLHHSDLRRFQLQWRNHASSNASTGVVQNLSN